MGEQWAELLEQLPTFLGGHILLSLAALAAGLVLSVPLGIWVSRRPRLAELTLAVAGVIQTIPSLALLALMVILLGLVGFEPAFVALTLYSVLPILANTVTGLRGVDPALVEAARGLGMSNRQMLRRVQLPLAAPVIISGIRTATVLVVGTATLASPVGGRSLGNYIFQGLESHNHVSTIFGCVLAALLAVVLDQLVHVLEIAARRRSRALAWVGLGGLLLVLAGGLYPLVGRYFATPRASWAYVGSGPFTEQHVLSEVLRRKLEDAGFRADQRKSMSEGILFMALVQDEIDCTVNYTGNVWTLLMKHTEFPRREAVLEGVTRYYAERGVVCRPLGFENAYRFAMRKDHAARLKIRKVADLAAHANSLRLVSDLQFLSRPEWFTVRDRYGLEFLSMRSLEPTLMPDALKEGAADVITAYTSDGRVTAYDLLLLEDEDEVFPPYDAVLLVSARGAARPGFLEALGPLTRGQGAIDVEAMRRANLRVDGDGWSPRRAATELLATVERGR